MRNVNRIYKIIFLLLRIWLKNPDLRLGQLIGNCFDEEDLYYKEDEELELALKETYGRDLM